MRTSLLCMALLVLPAAVGQQHGKGPGKVLLSELPPEQRGRVERLWKKLVCACPDENWSKLLDNCPDGCADPQKQEVIRAVTAGQSDTQVLADQEARYGPKVRAEGAGFWMFLAPFGAALMFLGMAFRRVRARAAAVAPVATAGSGSVSATELARVERELKEIE